MVATANTLKLVVKRGFLEYIQEEPTGLAHSRPRALTDPSPGVAAGCCEPILVELSALVTPKMKKDGPPGVFFASKTSAGFEEAVSEASTGRTTLPLQPATSEDSSEEFMATPRSDDGPPRRSPAQAPRPAELAWGPPGMWRHANDVPTFYPSGSLVAEGLADGMISDFRGATTCMLRNIPAEYNIVGVIAHLDAEGFSGLYDFAYLPRNFETGCCFGYGFINFVSPEAALRFRDHFEGFSRWAVPSDKAAAVSWSEPYQGLEAHVARYRDSPMMHESVPDDFKPRLFSNGIRVPFPPPTRRIKAPRVRRSRVQAAGGA